MNIDEYVTCFINKQEITDLNAYNARILRGKKDSDFQTLSDDKNRKLVFVMDDEGLQKIVGNSTYEMLIKTGYHPNYIEQLFAEKTIFKLIIFPKINPKMLATWDNVLDMVVMLYPDTINQVTDYIEQLKETRFEEIEKLSGHRFADISKNYFKNAASLKGLAEFRFFLYHSIYLREYYQGDGFTKNYKGEKIFREYVIFNTQISYLSDYRIIDLEIWKEPYALSIWFFYNHKFFTQFCS